MIRRREFITLLGGAASWPLPAGAQPAAMAVIGFLGSATAEGYSYRLAAFRQALNESGFIEGRNVAIEFRWADNQYDRLAMLAGDLVRRRVAVIVAVGAINAALAAKAATQTIPIIFALGSDPVQFGLVSNLARPGGNVTGVTSLNRELMAKHLEILRELIPGNRAIGLLVNPNNPNTDPIVRELRQISDSRGSTLHVVAVNSEADLETAFPKLLELGAGAFMCATDSIFSSSFNVIGPLASRYRMPGIYSGREPVENGGLMSYGGRWRDEYRLVGQYTARILKGEKPGDLPVQQATKVEFVINLKVTNHILFINRRVQLITQAARHDLPAMYSDRDIAEAGGLMSYGPATADLHRQAGIYTGRILKGEKPADLPVMQPVKFEFVINLQTAKILGITVPPTLLAIADEIIE